MNRNDPALINNPYPHTKSRWRRQGPAQVVVTEAAEPEPLQRQSPHYQCLAC